jgi:VanZ family protein
MDRNRGTNGEWTRVAVAALVLFVASLIPAKRHDPPRPAPYGVDKALHAVGHATFAAALLDALDTEDRPPGVAATAVVVVVISVGYGLVLEGLQQWVPGRRYEHGDVVASAVGSAAAVVLVRSRRRSRCADATSETGATRDRERSHGADDADGCPAAGPTDLF